MCKSPEQPTILQKIGRNDKSAVRDCIYAYSSFIWAAVKKNAVSIEQAEATAQEIFLDIWDYAVHFDPEKCSENKFIALLVCRRIIKLRRKNQTPANFGKIPEFRNTESIQTL